MDISNVRYVLAGRIKEERQKRQWTQAKLADLLNVKSASTIGNWESGAATPDYEKLCFLADIFNVSTDYLLGRSSDGDPSAKGAELIADGQDIQFKYDCCDEVGQGAIDNCIDYHYKRCTAELDSVRRTQQDSGSVGGIQRLFLHQDIDEDYEQMRNKTPYLRALKKDSHKSCLEITKYLWDIGYGDEICLAFVIEIFGRAKDRRVPSMKLFRDIEAFLKGRYMVIPNVEKK